VNSAAQGNWIAGRIGHLRFRRISRLKCLDEYSGPTRYFALLNFRLDLREVPPAAPGQESIDDE
jgi:hypothetical protein